MTSVRRSQRNVNNVGRYHGVYAGIPFRLSHLRASSPGGDAHVERQHESLLIDFADGSALTVSVGRDRPSEPLRDTPACAAHQLWTRFYRAAMQGGWQDGQDHTTEGEESS